MSALSIRRRSELGGPETMPCSYLHIKDTGQHATGAVVQTGNSSDGETVTIGGTIYENDLSADGVTAGNVAFIPANNTKEKFATALAAAINLTKPSVPVTATDNGAGRVDLTADFPGTNGNLAVADTGANTTSTSLTGGTDGMDRVVPANINDLSVADTLTPSASTNADQTVSLQNALQVMIVNRDDTDTMFVAFDKVAVDTGAGCIQILPLANVIISCVGNSLLHYIKKNGAAGSPQLEISLFS